MDRRSRWQIRALQATPVVGLTFLSSKKMDPDWNYMKANPVVDRFERHGRTKVIEFTLG